MHLYLALLFHRDYFDRPDASLSNSFAPQRLLYPGQMHLYLALLCRRDYFDRLNASLSGFFVPQGLFRPAECISIWLFCTAGIISPARMHPITGRPSLKTSLPGHSVNFRFNQFSFTSNSLSQIVTSNSRSQPDTHFAVDMFPYRKPSFFRSLVSNPNFRKSPEICRFLALDFISLTSRLPSRRALKRLNCSLFYSLVCENMSSALSVCGNISISCCLCFASTNLKLSISPLR